MNSELLKYLECSEYVNYDNEAVRKQADRFKSISETERKTHAGIKRKYGRAVYVPAFAAGQAGGINFHLDLTLDILCDIFLS